MFPSEYAKDETRRNSHIDEYLYSYHSILVVKFSENFRRCGMWRSNGSHVHGVSELSAVDKFRNGVYFATIITEEPPV
jgi:hypothetical protein